MGLEKLEQRISEVERTMAELRAAHDKTLNGRGGVLESLEDLQKELYGDDKRGDPGLLKMVRALVRTEEQRATTIRNLKWLTTGSGAAVLGLLYALLRQAAGQP